MTLGNKGLLDRKVFLEQAFTNFSEPNFGLGFADPRGTYKICQITAEIFRNLANSRCTVITNLNSNFQKLANKSFLKNSIR
jgi:hypothetical protein